MRECRTQPLRLNLWSSLNNMVYSDKMNKILTILMFILTINLLFISCTYDNPSTRCIEQALQRYDMRRYNGHSITGCELFLIMYEWKNEYYFDDYSHCIDKYFPNPTNCDGSKLSASFSDPIYDQFIQEAIELRIIGVRW